VVHVLAVLQKMLRTTILIVASALALSSCRERTYEDGVESRLLWALGVEKLPASCKIGGSTIDFGDDSPTYQIEMTMKPEEFQRVVSTLPSTHTIFPELKTPYEQKIDLAEPFLARGEYQWQVENLGQCRLYYTDVAGRYFLIYTHRPPRN